MKAESEFRVDGAQLAALMRGSNGPAWQTVNRIAENVRGVAGNKYVPVRNGGLKASIGYEIRNEGGMPVGYVGAIIKYAVYVHEGFRHYRSGKRIAGRPFLRQALEEVMRRYKGK